MSSLGPLSGVVAAMDQLRSPGGCPWDAEQTHLSLAPYAIEEAYELAEAIETDDRDGLRSELGDLLLQVLFHARVAEEHPADPFDLSDVARTLLDKLHRRHPHVFGDEPQAQTTAEVEQAWHEIKKRERAESAASAGTADATDATPSATTPRPDVLAGIPEALPALARAQKVARRLRREGAQDADLLVAGGVADQSAAGATADHPADSAVVDQPGSAVVADLGRELMALVLRAEALGVDAEAALRQHIREISRTPGSPT